jgi:hypothetical protein
LKELFPASEGKTLVLRSKVWTIISTPKPLPLVSQHLRLHLFWSLFSLVFSWLEKNSFPLGAKDLGYFIVKVALTTIILVYYPVYFLFFYFFIPEPTARSAVQGY